MYLVKNFRGHFLKLSESQEAPILRFRVELGRAFWDVDLNCDAEKVDVLYSGEIRLFEEDGWFSGVHVQDAATNFGLFAKVAGNTTICGESAMNTEIDGLVIVPYIMGRPRLKASTVGAVNAIHHVYFNANFGLMGHQVHVNDQVLRRQLLHRTCKAKRRSRRLQLESIQWLSHYTVLHALQVNIIWPNKCCT